MSRVLVLNTGSSSLKWVVLDSASDSIVQHGCASWNGVEGGRHEAEIVGALDQVSRVDAVGHRVVHGGALFRQAVLVDEAVCRGIEQLAELAPLHNPAALAGIRSARRRFPEVPHVAAFDTAFHSTLEDAEALYAVPWQWTEAWGLRRFGFHGLSVEYAASRAAAMLGSVPARLAVCHLGAGCSVTAVLHGRSVETSMGFTPLEGLVMSRRSGSLDPGLVLYLLRTNRLTLAELDAGLNEHAGLEGVSDVSADMRDVLAARANGNQRAALAVAMFTHRVAATVGAQLGSLGGLDALVFTGGIGENSADVRAEIAARLTFAGVALDAAANEHATPDSDVSPASSPVHVLVIGAREDLTVLRAVQTVTGVR